MGESTHDAGEQARYRELVRVLGDPYGAEKHMATLLSRWLSDREIAVLVMWIKRRGGSEPQPGETI